MKFIVLTSVLFALSVSPARAVDAVDSLCGHPNYSSQSCYPIIGYGRSSGYLTADAASIDAVNAAVLDARARCVDPRTKLQGTIPDIHSNGGQRFQENGLWSAIAEQAGHCSIPIHAP